MNRGSLLRIGEVAKMYHLSVELLRYYDKIGLLKPEIVDSDSGYRYYGGQIVRTSEPYSVCKDHGYSS